MVMVIVVVEKTTTFPLVVQYILSDDLLCAFYFLRLKSTRGWFTNY